MMALLALEGWETAAGRRWTWKMSMCEMLQIASVGRKISRLRHVGWKSSGDVAVSVRSLTSGARLPRRAVGGKATSPASGPLPASSSVAHMKGRGGYSPSQPGAMRANLGGARLLESLSADAAVACMQTLASQCRADATDKQGEVLKNVGAAAVLVQSAANLLEGRTSQKAHISPETLAGGNAALLAQEFSVEGHLLDQDRGTIHRMEDEEKVCAARVLLQVCMGKKDDLSGRSLLELLRVMLVLRLYDLEYLTELADTIRRRLLRVLPSDGLAAIVCTYCFLCTASEQSLKMDALPHHVKCLSQLPAPVEGLIRDAFTELCVRLVNFERHQAEARAMRNSITSQIQGCSANACLVSRKCNELPTGLVSQLNADGAKPVDAASSETTNQGLLSERDTQRPPTMSSSQASAVDHPQNRLSQAGVVSCAWALSKLPCLRTSILLRHLEERLTPISPCIRGSSPSFPQTSPWNSSSAWRQELSRLQKWGVTVAAFVHLPKDYSSRVALTAEREMIEALANLRLVVLHDKSTLSNLCHAASVDSLLLHEQVSSSSAQAYVPIRRAFSSRQVLMEALQKSAQTPSSECPTLGGQAESLTPKECKRQRATTCAADAATICAAVTSALRLSAIHQRDNASMLEMLYLLHDEDPLMFLLPAKELCYFLAAAYEGLGIGLDVFDEGRTLAANTDHTMAAHSHRAPPACRSLQKNGFSQLPVSLLWALLLLPRITAAGEGLFEVMPARTVALLLTMLSLLPGRLATYRHANVPLYFAYNVVGDGRAVEPDTRGYFFCRQRKDVPSSVAQNSPEGTKYLWLEGQHTSSSPVEREFNVQAFVDFEATLKKFSCDLCRNVVQRAACFGQRDLLRSISAIKRLGSHARQLPLSGRSWLQHPDFSRVLDCLVRALRRWRQKAEERQQSSLLPTSAAALDNCVRVARNRTDGVRAFGHPFWAR